jgi:hypothetical protein
MRAELVDIVCHQVELVMLATVGGMESGFGWWEPENQPSIPDVDIGETENVVKEGSVGFGVLGVDDDVCAVDHLDLLAGRGGLAKAWRSLGCVRHIPVTQ